MAAGSSGDRARSDEPLLATTELLRLAQSGDDRARAELLTRYAPRLRLWASGRLPLYARSLFDTGDLVQETLVRVFQNLERIESRGAGAFQTYVRSALLNRLRDEVRWAARRPGPGEVPETLEDRAPSPLENAIGAEVLERYEAALAGLSETDQELLHLRIELDFDYKEIAEMTGRQKADTARVAVQRALTRLANGMHREA